MAAVVKVGSLAGAIASASYLLARNPASADRNLDAGSFFSGSPSSTAAAPAAATVPAPSKEQEKPRNDAPRTSAAGFDPEALERGAKALREINSSSHVKKVFELMKKQEDTRLAEESTLKAKYKALQAQHDTERQRVMYEEQKKINQQQAQTKAQLARYDDELARKRMQAEHESNRQRNQELVRMQEEAAVRQEQIRRNTEEQIQAQRRQTEKERAEVERESIRVRAEAERESIRVKAMADAEGRVHEAKMAEDVNRRLLVERAKMEKDKLLAAIDSTFSYIGGGLNAILTDRNKLIVAVGGATALAAGVYSTREGARVIGRHMDRILGQPSILRETSRGKYPWSNFFSRKSKALGAGSTAAERTQAMKSGQGFGDVILPPSLHSRVRQLASVTANCKKYAAPYRNMLFYGPPGTGKTMAAKVLAQESGLDYAMMTGGDVAPLGANAVTKIHELFDWAGRSRKGLVLFIDEAEAFLCERNKNMNESQRSALTALLYHTGDQSLDIVMVLATNRPSDLDSAVLDRVDEALEFPLPGEEERLKLLNLYFSKYIAQAGSQPRSWRNLILRGQQHKIEIKGITEEVLREAAEKTEGFSGREIAKLMATVQGAVYGSQSCVLDADIFREVVDYKVAEHIQRRTLTGNNVEGKKEEGLKALLHSRPLVLSQV